MTETPVERIAIIGMAGRFPGAGDTASFWRNLAEGIDSVRDFSRDEQAALGLPERELQDPDFVASSPVLDDTEWFDARLFGMNRPETEITDPGHRLFLELSHTALEDAGYDPARFPGRIGAYTGTGQEDYKFDHVHRNAKVMSRLGPLYNVGLDADYVATLTSYKLGLRGPSLTMHSACSTSLVTLHLACVALRAGDCEMALAGGVHVPLPVGRGYVYVEGGVMSPDGRCRPFDASGAGTVWGAGGGVVVLKTLSDALRDGDTIRAVVLSSAVNNDGAKDSFAGPGESGQVEVVTRALEVGGVDPRTVSYVEAHATGTAVGDPVEVAALTRVFGAASDDRGWCGLGSVKSNIGHLSQAAGIAGVVKTVLALEHRQLPPTLHVRTPNPAIDLETGPFRLINALTDWDVGGGPRRAGVSSFGIGGTNAHAVLEEAPAVRRPRREPRPAHLLRLSAETEPALAATGQRLAEHLAAHPDADLGDVAHTLTVGRAERRHRAAVVARDPADAAAALGDAKRVWTGEARGSSPRVAFLFSGQGSQYAGMGTELYRTEPVFRAAVDTCADMLAGELGDDVRTLLFAGPGDREEADLGLRQTSLTQPALFVVEYSLAELWRSWGVEPAAMVGHSVGEYVAATLAGVFTLPDALRLVVARGRLMQSMPAGSMLAVNLDESEVAGLLPEGLTVATVNAPGSCVLAGPTEAVDAFAVQLGDRDVALTRLRTSHAFHSAMMDPILADFTAAVAAVPRREPRRPFLSNVTGDWITTAEATDPAYWSRHLRQTVRFGACVARLVADGPVALVECGPGRQLVSMARVQTPPDGLPPLPSLPGPTDPHGDLEVLGAAVGRLWTVGVPLAEGTLDPGGSRVPLPTYPYERQHYWVDPDPADTVSAAPVPRRPVAVEDWFSVPTWRQEVAGPASEPFGRCLAFTGAGLAAEIVAALRSTGVEVIEVVAGDGYGVDADGRYTLRPGDGTDLEKLVADLAVSGGVPARVLHAWPLAGDPAGTDVQATWQAQELGFFSLLGLIQAVAATQLVEPVHVDVLTAGVEDVTGADLTRPEHATIAGIARVVPLEIQGLSVRHVDLDPVDGGRRAVESCVDELFRPPDGAAVALRHGRRWQRHYQAVPLAAPADLAAGLRERGVYLITGGLGGLGVTLAEDLARRVQARLVLLGRSGMPPRSEWDDHLRRGGGMDRLGRAITAVRRIEDAGGEVLVLSADVTDADDLRRARAEVLARFDRLDGIIHAAGVPGDGVAELKDRSVAEQVLAPKLAGTLALARTFGPDDLDFVALFSSVTAVVGGFGQVDYCAANAFLDAIARGGHGFRARVLSIDWGGWLDVGMAAEGARAATDAVGHPLLSTARALGEGRFSVRGVVSPRTHWVLDQHRVGAVPVLPGTGHLELAHCAFRSTTPPPSAEAVVELRDVSFVQPLTAPGDAGVDIEVTVTPGTEGAELQVASGPDGTIHAVGSAGWVDPGPAPWHDVDAIRARCSPAEAAPTDDKTDEEEGLVTVGPSWPVPVEVRVGRSEQLARLQLVDQPATGDYWLHPALLDRAVGFPRLDPGPDGGGWLPFGYGRVVARRPLPDRVWSHVRYADSGADDVISADVIITDDEGHEVVAVTDFLLRRIAPGWTAVAVRDDPPAPSVVDDGEIGIRPLDGADAFHRLLAVNLGPQVVATAVPLDDLVAQFSVLDPEPIDDEVGLDPGPAEQPRMVDGDYVAPQTELEATLATIWGEVLGIGEVGVTDDFFELGGNSMVGVQLVAQVRKAVGVKLPMRTLFELPTVAEIAAKLEELRGTEDPAEEVIPRLPRR